MFIPDEKTYKKNLSPLKYYRFKKLRGRLLKQKLLELKSEYKNLKREELQKLVNRVAREATKEIADTYGYSYEVYGY